MNERTPILDIVCHLVLLAGATAVSGGTTVRGAAGAGAASSRSSDGGSVTLAVMPSCSLRRRATRIPCRWASRLTTKRPIRRAVSGVMSPPERSSRLSSPSASGHAGRYHR